MEKTLAGGLFGGTSGDALTAFNTIVTALQTSCTCIFRKQTQNENSLIVLGSKS
jgi:hypothetical protein